MKERELTCVVCPAGCKLTAVLDESGKVVSVTGHTCPRGKTYAESEITHPVRTLTTTIFLKGEGADRMLPVKTSKPLSKELLFDAMRQLNGFTAEAPVKAGDVLIRNFMEDGVDLLACKTLN